MLLGPVYNAAHGGSVNPWFCIGVGVFVLVGAWGRYFKLRKTQGVPLTTLMGLTVIGGIFILLGARQLFK